MYLIFNLGSPEAIARGLRLLPLLRQSNGRLVQISLDMSLYFHAHRYIKVLAQMQRLPMVLAGVAVQKLQTMRRYERQRPVWLPEPMTHHCHFEHFRTDSCWPHSR